jgi:hypothetical protein
MCGNVLQWTDTIIITSKTHFRGRGIIGGSFCAFNWELKSIHDRCDLGGLPERLDGIGFRVATVPRQTPEKH